MSLSQGGSIARPLGTAVLDLERSYLVTAGAARFEVNATKSKYLTLLDGVIALRRLYPDDFYTLWTEVRKLVYSRAQTHITYCIEKPSMAHALVDGCVNCVGETYLMVALFLDARVRPPAGYRLGAQDFRDHLRPVLYHEGSRQTYDLATGGVGPFRSSIVTAPALWRALFLGASSARTATETELVRATPIEFVYRDEDCTRGSWPTLRGPETSADLNGLSGCRYFRLPDQVVAARSDNEAKTTEVTFNEKAVGATAQRRSGGRSNTIGEWAEVFTAVAPNLIPQEREIFERVIRRGVTDDDFADIADEGDLVRQFGFGHLLHRPTNVITMGPLITAVRERPDPTSGAIEVTSKTRADTSVEIGDHARFTVRTTDPDLFGQMTSAPLFRRVNVLVDLFAAQTKTSIRALRGTSLVGSDLASSLAEFDRDPSLREHLYTLGAEIRKFNRLVRTFGYHQVGTEVIPPLGAMARHRFAQSSGVEDVVNAVADAFDQISADPAAVNRWISESPERLARALGPRGYLTALGLAHGGLSTLMPSNARLVRFKDFASSQNILVDGLVFDLLRDRHAFYTVAPDPDEAREARPRPARQILEPRPPGSSRVREDTAVRLPEYRGLRCPAGFTGYYGAGVVIECGPAGDRRAESLGETPASPEQTDTVLNPAGADDRLKLGRLREPTTGDDPTRGEVAGAVADITPSITPPLDVDPRPEVHLLPEVWRAWLSTVDPDFLNEPVIQVLLHHVYRRKLAPVFDDPELAPRLRLIDIDATERPDFVLLTDDWYGLGMRLGTTPLVGNPVVIRGRAERTASSYDPDRGLGREDFFRVARGEVAARKPGFIYLDRRRTATSLGELATILGDVAREREHAGAIVPTRVRDGDQIYEVFAAEGVAGALITHHPDLASRPRDLSPQRDRQVLYGPNNRPLGILKQSGRYFGQDMVTYFSYDSPTGDAPEVRLGRGFGELRDTRPFKPH